MKNYYYVIEEAVKGNLETAIEYSVPLIVTALQYKSFKQENHQIKMKMIDRLVKEQNQRQNVDGYVAWLYGRVVYSNKINNSGQFYDSFQLSPIRNFVSKLNKPKDEYEAWALGYFSLDSPIYSKKRENFIDYSESVSKKIDKIWAYNMFMTACVYNNDSSTYSNLKSKFQSLGDENDIFSTLDQIPLDDYRGWAYGLHLLNEAKLDSSSPSIPKILDKLNEIKQTQKIINDLVLLESYLINYNENFGK